MINPRKPPNVENAVITFSSGVGTGADDMPDSGAAAAAAAAAAAEDEEDGAANIERDKRKSNVSMWNVFGHKLPRGEVVFGCQMVMLFTVVTASIYNLSVRDDRTELWTALLSSCLGYILPNPRLNRQ